jgi:hypothetical protein
MLCEVVFFFVILYLLSVTVIRNGRNMLQYRNIANKKKIVAMLCSLYQDSIRPFFCFCSPSHLNNTKRTVCLSLSDADKALVLKTLTTRCIHFIVHFTSVRKHATKHFHIIIIIII